MQGGIAYRKLDHLRICLDSRVRGGESLLRDVLLPYQPGASRPPESVDTSVWLGSRRLSAPLMVTGITGGHPAAMEFNCMLGRLSASRGIAVGVGSQRAGLEHVELQETYRAVRSCGGDEAVVVANIGVAQLLAGSPAYAERVVEMIEADALAVHVNPAQEAFQPEGDVVEAVVDAVAKVLDRVDVPVIVKETGHGLDAHTVHALRGVGVRFFDVSGVGGTSWVLVEAVRGAGARGDAGRWLAPLGNPTALAVIEARWWAPDACIIASGGAWDGWGAASALLLGADMVGVALPILRLYVAGGYSAVARYVDALIYAVRAAVGLSGAGSLEEYWEQQVTVTQRLRSLAAQRGIDFNLYQAVRGWGGRGRCRA